MVTQITGFDLKDALERFNGDTAILHRYVKMLFSEFEATLPKLIQWVNEAEWQSVKESLHTLKGSAACMSAVRLFDLCASGEQYCRNQASHALLLVISDIQSYLSNNRHALM